MRDRAVLWPPAIMACLFFVSGQSELANPAPGLSLDKLAHFAVFGALATAWIRLPALQRRGQRGAWIAFALAAFYGIADECRQSFTPGRSVEVADAVADALGALTAVLFYRGWPGYRRLLEKRVG